MTLTGRHITAGDLTPVTIREENTYGTPTGDSILYGDVAEGGSFTFTDTANPYLSWRYGSRSFSHDNYVTQQKDAGFKASLEVRDIEGWERIIEYATGAGGTSGDPLLPTRTEMIGVRTGANQYNERIYYGCKTDRLTIRADAPGGVVLFDEEALASRSVPATLGADTAWADNSPAVQWMNGITIDGNEMYPQSFSLSIANNLARNRVPNNGDAITGALLEGRREIELEFDVWMEDLNTIAASINNADISGDIIITLGLTNPVTLTLSGCRWMSDGTNPDLIQDKQREKLKIRVGDITVSTVAVLGE